MNSSIEIAEAIKLADKLIDRTREGRLTWQADGILRNIVGTTDVSGATAFSTILEGNLKAKVSIFKRGQDEQLTFSLIEFDPQVHSPSSLMADVNSSPDKDVLDVFVDKDPSFGYDSVSEKQLAGLLIDLYRLARRSALKIDGSVEKALSYLDKHAV
ncbi:MAG: hypothetical protein WBE76_26825 [Terracidiphilus sp.]